MKTLDLKLQADTMNVWSGISGDELTFELYMITADNKLNINVLCF
jgi:hypothetical protein